MPVTRLLRLPQVQRIVGLMVAAGLTLMAIAATWLLGFWTDQSPLPIVMVVLATTVAVSHFVSARALWAFKRWALGVAKVGALIGTAIGLILFPLFPILAAVVVVVNGAALAYSSLTRVQAPFRPELYENPPPM